MVIFLLAYGVAQQAILYPNEAASWSMLSRIFFRPYFQVYGELFVDPPDTGNYSFLYNNQINARALIGQSAMGYCAGKPMGKSRFF